MEPAKNQQNRRRRSPPRHMRGDQAKALGVEVAGKQGEEEMEVMEMFEILRSDIGGLHKRIDDVKDDLGKRIDGVELGLGKRIDSVEQTLGKRIDGVEQTLGKRIDGVEKGLGKRIDDVAQRLDKRIDDVKEDLGKRIDQTDSHIAQAKTDLSHQIEVLRGEVEEMRNRKLVALGVAAAVVAAVAVTGTFAMQLYSLLP